MLKKQSERALFSHRREIDLLFTYKNAHHEVKGRLAGIYTRRKREKETEYRSAVQQR